MTLILIHDTPPDLKYSSCDEKIMDRTRFLRHTNKHRDGQKSDSYIHRKLGMDASIGPLMVSTSSFRTCIDTIHSSLFYSRIQIHIFRHRLE